ncbi:MAG TPA: PQQ-binding-like beta-propeller repeat protein, partial [Bryobacteraceae bacterium]|nr:PQQ-binding-like beta-propeller repeat protein [Bryobacteraceae bacterium]
MTRRTLLMMAQAMRAAPKAQGVPWTQWGGPHRNFQTESTGIKEHWPARGPRVVWKRVLGEGYSSPSVEAGVLYTMYGKPREEIVVAASTDTGQTLWEHSNPVQFQTDYGEVGNGPYATPLIVGDRLYTTGAAGRLQCLDRRTGKLIWAQELWQEHRGTRLMYGYASSPIAFRATVIVPVGGRGSSVMAFRQVDGRIAWAKNEFPNAYSSPLLIDVDGLQQLAVPMDGAVIAVNPHNGDLQWQVPFRAQYGIAVSSPVWGPGNLLFVSAEYGAGTKVIELKRTGNQTTAAELWTSNRLRLHHGNAMRLGDTIYFSSGGKGSPAILSAVDVRTGKIHWQERGISKATF